MNEIEILCKSAVTPTPVLRGSYQSDLHAALFTLNAWVGIPGRTIYIKYKHKKGRPNNLYKLNSIIIQPHTDGISVSRIPQSLIFTF